jgi:hypothetical protein
MGEVYPKRWNASSGRDAWKNRRAADLAAGTAEQMFITA